MCGPPSLILPDLWLGDLVAAQDEKFIGTISNVINATNKYPNYFEDKLTYHRIPLKNAHVCKTSTDLLMISLDEIANKIHDILGHGGSVLVHCKRGHHRSASLIAAYLIKFYKFTVIEAVEFLRIKRPCCFRKEKCIVKILIPFYHFVNS